jgi:uncharacterized membrane protein
MANTHSVQTRRSVLKSLTFRVLVVIADLIVIYLITRRIDTTLSVTILTNLVSTALYYTHERVWNKIQWGRVS